MPRDERLVGRDEDVVHRGADVLVAAADLDDVAEPLRGDHSGTGAVTVDERVRRQRRAVDDQLDAAEEVGQVRMPVAGGGLGDGLDEALGRSVGRGVGLELAQVPVVVHDQAVGEGAADVDGDAVHADLGAVGRAGH